MHQLNLFGHALCPQSQNLLAHQPIIIIITASLLQQHIVEGFPCHHGYLVCLLVLPRFAHPHARVATIKVVRYGQMSPSSSTNLVSGTLWASPGNIKQEGLAWPSLTFLPCLMEWHQKELPLWACSYPLAWLW